MASRRQGKNAALESYDETLSEAYIARQAAKQTASDQLIALAVEAEQSASEWEHEEDCSLHCMYVRMAESYRERAEKALR
jgi:hypothetical protein